LRVEGDTESDNFQGKPAKKVKIGRFSKTRTDRFRYRQKPPVLFYHAGTTTDI
jgi:hypothetical protein